MVDTSVPVNLFVYQFTTGTILYISSWIGLAYPTSFTADISIVGLVYQRQMLLSTNAGKPTFRPMEGQHMRYSLSDWVFLKPRHQ